MRGEYKLVVTIKRFCLGSPPHAWRIPGIAKDVPAEDRITSTCVENTYVHVLQTYSKKDHLHMRGEYPKIEALVAIPPGSPPHAWRIRDWDHQIFYIEGITSTCVENTEQSDEILVCGNGSPPHAWRIHGSCVH